MKSPWKFLVGITRRNPTQDKADADLPSSDEATASSEPNVAPPIEQKVEPRNEASGLTGFRGSDGDRSLHVHDLPTLAAIAAVAADKKATHTAATTVRARSGERRGLSVKSESMNIAPEPAQPLHTQDQTRALDDDIRQLREQLATKLQLQNSQLRKLLERFKD
jgi:hydroxypyruvate isomerase